MKNPQAYHESAVLLARELFPFLYKEAQNFVASKDVFEMKVNTVERHIRAIIEPLEAAANHDISQWESLETTIRKMQDRIVDLEGFLRQNGQ